MLQVKARAPEGGLFLRGSELHFHRLLEKLPAGAYTCDADGLITRSGVSQSKSN